MPAAEHGDGADLLDVVARRRAPAAQDAGLAVQDEEGLGGVGVEAVERLPPGLQDPMTRRGGSDLDEAIALLAVAQHGAREVEHHGPDSDHVRVGRAHRHAVPRGEMARGRSPAEPVDVHETGPAGAERGAIRILAELRKRNAQAVDRFQDRGPRRDLDGAIIDNESHFGNLANRTVRPADLANPW